MTYEEDSEHHVALMAFGYTNGHRMAWIKSCYYSMAIKSQPFHARPPPLPPQNLHITTILYTSQSAPPFVALTFPPRFMPSTAVDSAGGGFGPPVPENKPPALSEIFFTGCSETDSPTMNSNGCTWIIYDECTSVMCHWSTPLHSCAKTVLPFCQKLPKQYITC
jgi:hypothetical protein